MIKEDLTGRIGEVTYKSLSRLCEKNDLVLVGETALKYTLDFVDNRDLYNELDQLANSYSFWIQKIKYESNNNLFITEGTKNTLLAYRPIKLNSRDFFKRLKIKNAYTKQENLRNKLINEFEKKERIFKLNGENYLDYYRVFEENKYLLDKFKGSNKKISSSSIENVLVGACLSERGKEVSILISDYVVSDFMKQVMRGNRYENLSGYMRIMNDYFMKLI